MQIEAKGKNKITTGNLVRLTYTAGFAGVPDLARRIGRARGTVWRAVRWPDQFGPTYKLIERALENPHDYSEAN